MAIDCLRNLRAGKSRLKIGGVEKSKKCKIVACALPYSPFRSTMTSAKLAARLAQYEMEDAALESMDDEPEHDNDR